MGRGPVRGGALGPKGMAVASAMPSPVSQRVKNAHLHRYRDVVGRLPDGPREEPVEIAIRVPRAILAERRERHEIDQVEDGVLREAGVVPQGHIA